MIVKCICINCEFYLSCWINSALKNFPLNYRSLIMSKINSKKNVKRILIYLPTLVIIQLNINSKNYKSEPDIIFCDSFIEQPGNWIT